MMHPQRFRTSQHPSCRQNTDTIQPHRPWLGAQTPHRAALVTELLWMYAESHCRSGAEGARAHVAQGGITWHLPVVARDSRRRVVLPLLQLTAVNLVQQVRVCAARGAVRTRQLITMNSAYIECPINVCVVCDEGSGRQVIACP